jgi:hypothetical protein
MGVVSRRRGGEVPGSLGPRHYRTRHLEDFLAGLASFDRLGSSTALGR